ncbi:hypothetical protein Q6247_27140, partial [Klebsiella pneumoniae]
KKTSQYNIIQIKNHNIIFIKPNTKIYTNIIIKKHTHKNNLTINIIKIKQQTNIHSTTKNQTSTIKKPHLITLKKSLKY